MKNERLVQAFEEARPDEAAKKRMLAGILAQQDAPETAKRPTRRIRRTLLIAAAVCALAGAAFAVQAGRQRWTLPAPETYTDGNNGIYDVHETNDYPQTSDVQPEEPAQPEEPQPQAPDEAVTEQDAPQFTDADFIQKAEGILLAVGLTDVDTSAASVVRQTALLYDREEAEVFFTQDASNTSVKFHAGTGAFLHLSSFGNGDAPDTPVCATEEDAEALAQSYYENLPVQQGYALSRIEKYDEELWSFCFSRQVTQTLFNPYEEVRVVVDLTTGRLVLCNVFFFPLLDDHEADDVPLTQEQAIEAAKEQSGMEMEGFELKQAEVCCVLPNWFYTEGVWSADVRYAEVSRLAWVLTYEDDGYEIVSQNIFYVDYYTGELIGGGAV